MQVCDKVFDTDNYGLFTQSQLAPVVGVVGPIDPTMKTQIMQSLMTCPFQSGNRLIFIDVETVDQLPKRKERLGYENYQCHGILKRDWVKKHQSRVFGCAIML